MMFLKVPFAEKDEAKALGARWNGERKSWYVPDGKPTEAFERWLPPGGADFVPAKAAAAPKAKPASVDSYVGKSVIGKLYQELPHHVGLLLHALVHTMPLLIAFGKYILAGRYGQPGQGGRR